MQRLTVRSLRSSSAVEGFSITKLTALSPGPTVRVSKYLYVLSGEKSAVDFLFMFSAFFDYSLSASAASRSSVRALMHLERLGDAWAATSGRQRFRPSTPTNSIMRDVYAGPIDRPLPCLGAMSSRIALRRERLARSTRVCFGSSRSSTTLGTLPAGTPRNAAIPARSASSQLSISRTATRKHMPSAGVGSHSRQREGAHSS